MNEKWTPCTKRLPEEDIWPAGGRQLSEIVYVTVVNKADGGKRFVDVAYTEDGKWKMPYPIDGDPDFPDWCEVVAWRKRPSRGRQNDDDD